MNSIQTIKQLCLLLDIYSYVILLIGLVIGVGACISFIYFFFKKEWRLFQNRRRPIMIFRSADQNMGVAFNLLQDTKLFKVEEPTENYQDSIRLNKHSLVIIGYSSGMNGFKDIVESAKQKRIPIIVYAKPSDISDEDMKILNDYCYYSICNIPLRLINDVFTILSTFPNVK